MFLLVTVKTLDFPNHVALYGDPSSRPLLGGRAGAGGAVGAFGGPEAPGAAAAWPETGGCIAQAFGHVAYGMGLGGFHMGNSHRSLQP